MALLKPRRLTPARLQANRRNAQFSTGPRTLRGKGQSRLNRLQHGEWSSLCGAFMEALLCAPPGCLDSTAQALLDPVTARHPLFAKMAEVARILSAKAETGAKIKKISERTQ